MNKVKKIKNILLTSFVLFILGNYSYKIIKGNLKANKILNRHANSNIHNELIVAHRGFSGLYPENSLVSIIEALKSPCCDMIEIDVRFTKNKIFVLHHDSFININDLIINIEDMNLDDDLEELIVNNYPRYRLNNLLYDDTLFLFKRYINSFNNEEKIMRLSTVLKNYNFDKKLILDIKTNNVDLDMIEELNRLLFFYKEDIYIQSDNHLFLLWMHKLYPDYKYLYIVKSFNSLKNCNDIFSGYTIKYSLLDKIRVKNNKLYLIYTINSNQKYLNLIGNKNYNSDMYIITDNPDYICALSENKKLRK